VGYGEESPVSLDMPFKNKEDQKKYNKIWYQKNKEKRYAQIQEYKKNNPETEKRYRKKKYWRMLEIEKEDRKNRYYLTRYGSLAKSVRLLNKLRNTLWQVNKK